MKRYFVCFLAAILLMITFTGCDDGKKQPMIMYENHIYEKVSDIENVDLASLTSVGVIASIVDETKKPTQNLQSNRSILGKKVYRYDVDSLLIRDGAYQIFKKK